MGEIYVATDDQLQEAIYKGISKYFTSTKDAKELPDTMNLDNAVKMLEEHGFSTSKAKIYKLSSAGEIPFRKYVHNDTSEGFIPEIFTYRYVKADRSFNISVRSKQLYGVRSVIFFSPMVKADSYCCHKFAFIVHKYWRKICANFARKSDKISQYMLQNSIV